MKTALALVIIYSTATLMGISIYISITAGIDLYEKYRAKKATS